MNQIKSIISKIDDKDILRIYEIGDEFNHHHKIIYQTELEEDELGQLLKDLEEIHKELRIWGDIQTAMRDTDMNKFLKGFKHVDELDKVMDELSKPEIQPAPCEGLIPSDIIQRAVDWLNAADDC